MNPGGDTDGDLSGVPSVPSTSTPASLDLAYTDLRLREEVGRGGNAVVHRVTVPSGESVALKRPYVDEGRARERFLEEAETWSHLEHDHIVRVHGWGVDPEPWIAMELADDSLADHVDSLRVDEALWVSVAIARALRYAHERGVMHYDLKPENVLLFDSPDGWPTPKVTDWGLSERLLTQEGKPKGLTYAYAAPEQFERGVETGPATDIYQLGSTVYAILTGRPLATGGQAAVVETIREGSWPAPTTADPTLPPATDRVLRRALAPDPGDRYENVLAFERELTGLFWDAHDATSATHPGIDPRRSGTVGSSGTAGIPSVSWRTNLDDTPLGSPVVGDGRVYVGTRNGRVAGLEVGSGSVVADADVQGRLVAGPELVDDELRVVSEDSRFVRLGMESLDPHGDSALSFTPARSLLNAGDRLYTVTNRAELVATDRQLGVEWRTALPGNPGGLVAGTEGTVVVPTFDGTACLDAADGTIRWVDGEGTPHRATPAVTADAVVTCGRGRVAELALETGERRWRLDTGGAVSGVAVTPARVYAGTTAGTVVAIDRATGTPDWKQSFKGREMTAPVAADGTVYVGATSEDGRGLHRRTDGVFGLDGTSGDVRWSLSPRGDVVGSPVPLDGRVVFATADGTVAAVE